MVDFSVLQSGDMFGQFISALVLLLVVVLIGGVLFLLLQRNKYIFKGIILKYHGDGKGNYVYTGCYKQRFAWRDKARTSWKQMYPFLNKKIVTPFPPEFIYAGNNVVGANIGGNILPVQVLANQDVISKCEIIPHNLMSEALLTIQEVQSEFKGWWDANKAIIVAGSSLVIIFVGVIVGLNFYSKGIELHNQGLANQAGSINKLSDNLEKLVDALPLLSETLSGQNKGRQPIEAPD